MVKLHAEIIAKINFAYQQSSYPVLTDLSVENLGEENSIEDLRIVLSSNPPFIKPKTWVVDQLAGNGKLHVQGRDLELDAECLRNLSEAVRGTVTIAVRKGEEILDEIKHDIQFLAFNEWGGAGYMPELLAAFSTPNDPAIDQILKQAAEILRNAGEDTAIDGYASRSRSRVWTLISAFYSAIEHHGLTYAVPPASFERDGQKIRLPSELIDGGVATCLDTTMLFASCLEKAGLNPIIALTKGHAMVGVWLQPDELSTIIVEDAEILRKRVQLKELLLIETTLLTIHPSVPFSRSLKIADEKIAPECDEEFSAAIDIKRARSSRILPLDTKVGRTVGQAVSDAPKDILPIEEAPPLPNFDVELEEERPVTPQTRLERWQRKLLELTARNPLLSHRASKTSLNIICPAPSELEDKLSDGAKISIAAIPAPTTRAQDEEIHRDRTGESIFEEDARAALQNNQLLVKLEKDELQKKSVEIYRKAQTALQEGGSNTLYLALGFLLWKRDDKSDKQYRAPLILVPVNMERTTVRSGVKLSAHDDESKFNTTLLEMLRKDFDIKIPGLDGDLPKDVRGIDVTGVWNVIRRAIKDVPGFEVVEDVVLGHFSFAKYLMWKDLADRADALKNNLVVKHLIESPLDPYQTSIDFVDRQQVDRLFKPSDLYVPLPADASQMAVVATADRGKDFIIVGPPGTGKSQTIANLITHLLGNGKTVLFVSEKIAALNVVHRRLEEIGIGRFCLELHSNKAKKSDILARLDSAWTHASAQSRESWETQAKDLEKLRNRLNQVADCLHRRHPNGMSAHKAMGVKIRGSEFADDVRLSWPNSKYHDKEMLQALRETVENIRVQAGEVGDFTDNLFEAIETGAWSPKWQSETTASASALSKAVKECEVAYLDLVRSIGIELPIRDIAMLKNLEHLGNAIVACYAKQAAFALEPGAQGKLDAIEKASERLRRYADAQADLSCSYDPFAWRNLDPESLLRKWSEAKRAWYLKSFFAKRSVVKELNLAVADGTPDPDRDIKLLSELKEDGEVIDFLDGQLGFLKQWRKFDTVPREISNLRSLGIELKKSVAMVSTDAGSLAELSRKVRALIEDSNDLLSSDASLGRAATNFNEQMRNLLKEADDFSVLAGKSVLEHVASKTDAFDALRKTADHIASRHEELNNWCSWRRRRNEAIDQDLLPLIEAIEEGRLPVDKISSTFEAAYCSWWSSQLITEDHVLREFNAPEHMAAIDRFRVADEKFCQATAAFVAAKLSGQLPSQNDQTAGGQWGILKREIQKKRRHKPVRKLIEEVPEVITGLAPCLMMSPLSVAQYLPANQELFDVVIFDEASQITVWDAIGAIARGKQTVIAGDPKQMPPTNFFARADDDPDGDISLESDLESILDEMSGARVPECSLNLHYRSRRESLIAFSNSRYYEDSLITFPAPVTPDNGVSLVRPDGFYARGTARINQGEAKAIVKEIVRRLTHEDKLIRDQTIGVVTFNSEQQGLILDLLDEERRKTPGIEWAFSPDHVEPVFVKNLETVQGDERDVILFSITYGPDLSGRVTMNFGPLNKQGGERRLNVAMTRARSEMIVYSTLRPEDIDLSRSSAEAVKDLKHFLEYAERGPSALAAAVHGPVADFDSPFEIEVAHELKREGWRVHPQIGVSAFRIDLGIVHPDHPGVYLAGVECDGAMYHSTFNARERDKIRQAKLEDLGWTLFRVWSTDWWVNKSAAFSQLNILLTKHLEEDRRKRREKEVIAKAEQSTTDQERNESPALKSLGTGEAIDEAAAAGTPVGHVTDLTSEPMEMGAKTGKVPPSAAVLEDHSNNGAVGIEPQSLDVLDGRREAPHGYVYTNFDVHSLTAKPDKFFDEDYESTLRKMVDHVIDTEGPIHTDILTRRIARHHGWKKAGSRIRERILSFAQDRCDRTREDVGKFYWRKGTLKEFRTQIRYKNRDGEMKKVSHICREELRAIDMTLGLAGDEAELARSLGLKQLRGSTRQRLKDVLSN